MLKGVKALSILGVMFTFPNVERPIDEKNSDYFYWFALCVIITMQIYIKYLYHQNEFQLITHKKRQMNHIFQPAFLKNPSFTA